MKTFALIVLSLLLASFVSSATLYLHEDDFAGNGPLLDYTTNNANALPDVERVSGRYRAELTNNANDITLHYHNDQGRLDAKPVDFPFEVIARNIGIGTLADSQVPTTATGWPYHFAGVQVHVHPDFSDRTSSHVVVGHRGTTYFTVEGKNTNDGSSNVNDAGGGIVPDGRADIRIVGNEDHTLTVHWQVPNLNGPDYSGDSWTLYGGDGVLPGNPPPYGNTVYVGLITYAFGSTGLPFVGTCDALQYYTTTPSGEVSCDVPPMPSAASAHHTCSGKRKLHYSWDGNTNNEDICWDVQIKAVGSTKWKSLSKCTSSTSKKYKKSKIQAKYPDGFPDGKGFSETEFKLRARAKDKTKKSDCGTLKSDHGAFATSICQ